jgi:tRNA 2-thiouridine synthesizing protein A
LIELDATGLLCPLPVLKLQKIIKSVEKKERIRLITDDPAAVIDVPHFCNEQGHHLIEIFDQNGCNLFLIERG